MIADRPETFSSAEKAGDAISVARSLASPGSFAKA